MDWNDDTQEDEDARKAVEKAFTLVAEGPSLQFARQPKQRGGAGSTFGSWELRLEAHPPLFAGEGEAARLARADASAACRSALAANIQETLEATDAGVFQQLLDFCQQSHPRPAAAAAADANDGAGHRVPTGLVLSGGVNSADHCHTFPRLISFLRDAGCYVALLQPASMGRVPGDALGEVLRQFSGLADSGAEHWDALAEWYRASTAGAEAAAAGDDSGDEQQEEPEAEEEGSRHEARHKRQRGAARGAAADVAAAVEAAERAARPLVVVVEGTEGVHVQCLRDLILLASERYHKVPLTFVLGLTTTDKALAEMVPSELIDRCMQTCSFKLATAIARLDSLVLHVLLGGSGRWSGLLFSQKIWSQLTDEFLNHYYSAGSITLGLKLAALEHFRTQPLASLAAAALEGEQALAQAAAKLDTKTLAQAKRALSCRSAADVARLVAEAQAGWSRWAVGMHWLIMAAEAVGLRAQEFRPWKVLEEALCQGFATEGGRGQLKRLLRRIEPPLRSLDPEAAAALAEALQQRAAAVWGGADSAAYQLEGLAAAVAAAAADGEQRAQQEQQQGGAEAAASAQAQAPASGKQQKKAKRDVYHTKASRKAALVQKAAEAAAAEPKGGKSAAAAKKAREEAAPGARLAAWLAPALRTLLETPPTKLPGAVVFTCRDAASLACMTAEPRSMLHMALTEPHQLLPGVAADMGTSAAQEDACLAYTLFDQDPKCSNLADWYQAFAAVHGQGGADEERGEGGAAGGSKKPKKAAVKKAGGKKAAASKARGKAGSSAAGGKGGDEAANQRELAARFSQATAELQFVGFIRPAKRRRGDYAQRMIHMPAAGS